MMMEIRFAQNNILVAVKNSQDACIERNFMFVG